MASAYADVLDRQRSSEPTFVRQPGRDRDSANLHSISTVTTVPQMTASQPILNLYLGFNTSVKRDVWFGILDDLSELADGWCGPGSCAPAKAICDDIRAALPALRPIASVPEVEVDDDGTVALLWHSEGKTIGLTFVGNGSVVGTVSPQDALSPPWVFPATATRAIAAKLSAKEITPALL